MTHSKTELLHAVMDAVHESASNGAEILTAVATIACHNGVDRGRWLTMCENIWDNVAEPAVAAEKRKHQQ